MIDTSIRCLNAAKGENFVAFHGDCVDVIRQLPDNSIDLAVYSPPFSNLYIYTDSVADMGNTAGDAEFFRQYEFLVRELLRVVKPGRIVAAHCKELVYYQNQRGTAGLRDFPGDLIRAHVAAGFDFHTRITVRRCPVREMTKTKARGLLYKQLRADSTYSRVGLPEYFVVFRKWAKDGEEIAPVSHTHESFPLPQWQDWAEPVWMDTRETDVLNADRQAEDEKHICPLPLDLIERCVTLWSNPGDVVLSPFMGIGSEGYVSLKLKRRFVGVELHERYFPQAVRHLDSIERGALTVFDALPEANGPDAAQASEAAE